MEAPVGRNKPVSFQRKPFQRVTPLHVNLLMKEQISLRSILCVVVQSLESSTSVDVTSLRLSMGLLQTLTSLHQSDSTCTLFPPLCNDLSILPESESSSYQLSFSNDAIASIVEESGVSQNVRLKHHQRWMKEEKRPLIQYLMIVKSNRSIKLCQSSVMSSLHYLVIGKQFSMKSMSAEMK
ncbi:hypothetical protein RRG08_052532 [Elysia crispata]|uniref:Uncharacterized protein n=1 Tax=Elysia crispata TaxID=231223 RepID=A0AAE0Y8R9_9GAST|nr:hypothetical protein RRG08_052532 [Elysia crispata]